METLKQRLQQAQTLAQSYGLSIPSLEQGLEELEHFRMTVPVVGSFNTGKSSLFNALLGQRLLPTGITAETAVPVELTWGDNRVIVHRGDRLQTVGLGDLRDRMDLAEVRLLQAQIRHPLLQRLPNLILADLPGLDGISQEPEQLLLDYLSRSSACILCFSAEEPVVKESVAALLRELRLREVPIHVLLTKTDKLPQEEQPEVCRYLRRSLEQLLGFTCPPVLPVTARRPGGMDRMTELLLELQAQAEVLSHQNGEERLREGCASLRDCLPQLAGGSTLPLSEVSARLDQLEDRRIALELALFKEEERFTAQLLEGRKAVSRQIAQALEEAVAPFAAMILSGQSPESYARELLRGTLVASSLDHLEPAIRTYLRRTAALIHSQKQDTASETTPAPNRGRFLLPPAEEALSQLESLLPSLPQWPRRGLPGIEQLKQQVETDLLPLLQTGGEKVLDQIALAYDQAGQKAVREATEQERSAWEQTLEQLRAAKWQDDARRQDALAQLQADLEQLDRLTAADSTTTEVK